MEYEFKTETYDIEAQPARQVSDTKLETDNFIVGTSSRSGVFYLIEKNTYTSFTIRLNEISELRDILRAISKHAEANKNETKD